MKFKIALLLGLLSTSTISLASYDCYLGEVSYFAFNYETDHYTEARGQLMQIQNNQALYSLLGTNYGGDGMNSFALPKIDPINTGNGNTPIKAYICTEGMYPSRK